MIYLTAIGCIPGGSGTRLQTKITYNNNNEHQQYIEQTVFPTLLWAELRVRTVPRLWEEYPSICLTTEGKHGKPRSG